MRWLLGTRYWNSCTVGLITRRGTQARGGSAATKSAAWASSSGCSMEARRSALTGSGRWAKIGVSTSPGQIAQARMPKSTSSSLIEFVRATAPCLEAEYAAPPSLLARRPAMDEMVMMRPSLFLPHSRQHRPHHVVHPGEIDGNGLVPVLGCHVADRARIGVDARVVD